MLAGVHRVPPHLTCFAPTSGVFGPIWALLIPRATAFISEMVFSNAVPPGLSYTN
jgi:hypothetical protein